jgi:hypothetical protein
MRKMWVFALIAICFLSNFFINNLIQATPIEVTGAFHLRDNVSSNTVNISEGQRLTYGAASVVPNGNNGTSAFAEQGSTSTPLVSIPFSTNPNLFSYTIPYDPSLTGQWKLTFTNGLNQTVVQSPAVGGVIQMPFPMNMAISGSGTTPTFSWTIPVGSPVDGIRVIIWDLGQWVSIRNIADQIHLVQNLPGNTLNYTVPAILSTGQSLIAGRHYAVNIELIQTRDDTSNTINPNIINRSRAFFNFSPLSQGITGPILLPIVNQETQTRFSFRSSVIRATPIKVDPTIAVGYDYEIGAGNPNFASVMLPTGIGDDKYDLYIHNGTDYIFKAQLTGGIKYDFPLSGLSKFRILGIETSAMLDPGDGTAFITELTFVDDGEFTGTMTAITKDLIYLPLIIK